MPPITTCSYFARCPRSRTILILLGQIGVVGRDRAGVAVGPEVLTGIEAERGDAAERAAGAVAIARAVRLRGVFDEGEPVLATERANGVRVAGMSEEIDAGDRLRPCGHRLSRLLDVELPVLVAVDEDDSCTHADDRQDRGDERVRRSDHLVAGSDANRLVREREAGGPGGDAHAMVDAAGVSPFRLEPRHFLAEDVLRRGDCVEYRRVDLVLDGRVLTLQVDEVDGLHVAGSGSGSMAPRWDATRDRVSRW